MDSSPPRYNTNDSRSSEHFTAYRTPLSFDSSSSDPPLPTSLGQIPFHAPPSPLSPPTHPNNHARDHPNSLHATGGGGFNNQTCTHQETWVDFLRDTRNTTGSLQDQNAGIASIYAGDNISPSATSGYQFATGPGASLGLGFRNDFDLTSTAAHNLQSSNQPLDTYSLHSVPNLPFLHPIPSSPPEPNIASPLQSSFTAGFSYPTINQPPSRSGDNFAEPRRTSLPGAERKRRLTETGPNELEEGEGTFRADLASPPGTRARMSAPDIIDLTQSPERVPTARRRSSGGMAATGQRRRTSSGAPPSTPDHHAGTRASRSSFGNAPGTVERRQSDIVLPRWQPDAEVTNCPVCGKVFTFLNRRHHCR